MHVVAQPVAVEVQTVILLLLNGLKLSILCSSPWHQYDSRRQPREVSSTYAYRTMHHAHCCLRCEATTLILLYVLYRKEASGFFLCLNVKRDEHDSHYLLYECVSGTSTAKDKSYKKQYFEQTLHPYFLFLLLSLFAYTTHTLYVYGCVLDVIIGTHSVRNYMQL